MRKHLYLITESPDEELVGKIRAVDKRYTIGKKNEERVLQQRNLETNETFTERIVGLGYHDFEDQEDYEESWVEVVQSKLDEIDDEHLTNAGIDPEEVGVNA